MKTVLFITNVASPYRVSFFDELGKDMDVTVVYADRAQDHRTREANWFIQSQGRFREVDLQRRVKLGGESNLCMDVVQWLKKPFDHIVLCGYSSPTFMLAMAYMRLKKRPFYMEVDGGLIREESGLKYRFKRTLVSAASWWISSGRETTKYLCHYGAEAEKTFHYPFTSLYAADLLPQAPSREEKLALRRQLGVLEEKMAIYVGRFDPLKGMNDLLEAAAGLEKDTGVYFIGGEPTREHQDFCASRGLSNVHFVGFQKKDALRPWFMAADVLVLPTKSDVWGLVVNEAMAHGLPVVTTDKCVAGLELVEDGVNGAIVPIEDVPALTCAMQRVLDSDLAAMGAAALEKIRPYTFENMAGAHVEIFDRS